jgi:hypothetical protein
MGQGTIPLSRKGPAGGGAHVIDDSERLSEGG